MKSAAVFYHAGCPVCAAAETVVVDALDRDRFEVEVVDLGKDKHRVAEAEQRGVNSVPALVIGGEVFHINFGASLADLR